MIEALRRSSENSFLFDGPHGWLIHGRRWRVPNPRGTLIGVHGYSEHSGRYSHLAEYLNGHGFDVFWLDLPGHGLSDGKRNNIDDFEDYIRTFEGFVRDVERQGAKPPYHLFAHSLGGLISIRFLQASPLASAVQDVLLSGPLLGLDRFSDTKLTFLRMLAEVIPNFTIDNKRELSGPFLTHDEERMKTRLEDPLVNSHVTFHWFREFCKAREAAFAQIEKLRLPIFVLVGEEEMVVSKEAIKKFFERLTSPQKQIKVFPQMRHELVNEINRQEVFADILQWIESR